MSQKLFISSVWILIAALAGCGLDLPNDVSVAYDNLPATLDFNIDVKPILSDKCFACHGPDEGKIEAGLQLHDGSVAYSELPESPGKYAIVPGQLGKSQVYHRILSEDPAFVMPTTDSHLKLTAKEKAILIKWIEQGAKYERHWAFRRIEEQAIPEIMLEDWPTNPIDHFVLARLEQNKMTPGPEAEKSLLLRRVSLDLTGLPPTPEELNLFVNDHEPDAYERQVDRLLSSQAYAEKMAVDWLDLARYADTHGYQADRFRDMSPWRDWVIRSFEKNMPYDQFLTWQLAGDLLPSATREQILATGFNRLHPQNAEGGIVDEEFRVEYVADRASLTGTAFMGLTVGCARCHDHKYDPISQKDFYELFSFFNNINETGQISWDNNDIPVPTMMIPTEDQEKLLQFINDQEQRQHQALEHAMERSSEQFDSWLAAERYQTMSTTLHSALKAYFSLDGHLRNLVGSGKGKMDREYSAGELAHFIKGKQGNGLLLDGDAWLEVEPIGIYGRAEPFSIALWLYVPGELEEGVIFHKNKAVMLHGMKGYSLYLRDNKLELVMAHTYPDNAIIETTDIEIPKDQWIHLTWTYDGSSTAEGLKIYLNGQELNTYVDNDNLYKEIIFHNYEDIIYPKPIEPGLKIGARWRGLGLKAGRVDELRVYDRELTALEAMELGDLAAQKELVQKDASELGIQEKLMLKQHYLRHFAGDVKKADKEWLAVQQKKAEHMDKIKEVMVMKEMATPRQAYVLERGVYDAYGDQVFPDVPERILPFGDEYPRNRLGLAQWLLSRDHPLTARVAVNRYWQNYFGTGIVRTAEDFGNQGELPSHKELIDWLALHFMQSGWDVKALQKLIVMSSTYRQSSLCSPELRSSDPENRLLARGPAVRLSSEMLRDNALFASGLLNPDTGGRSVKPYQPEGLYQMGFEEYHRDTGNLIYKRSLYTYWKRTNPNPTLGTFDQPERSECTVRRQKTNTPLQALVLMNDPTYLEASRKIGESMAMAEDLATGIENAFVSLTGRAIRKDELEVLQKLHQREYKEFLRDQNRSTGWLSTGDYQISKNLDPNLVAANSVVANVIMNSDAAIMKR